MEKKKVQDIKNEIDELVESLNLPLPLNFQIVHIASSLKSLSSKIEQLLTD